MEDQSGGLWEWLVPFAFCVCAGWAIWHAPAYILDFIPPESPSLLDQISELYQRKDAAPGLPGLFGGTADLIDWAALVLMPIIFFIGTRTVRCAHMEYRHWRPIDRVALFNRPVDDAAHHLDDGRHAVRGVSSLRPRSADAVGERADVVDRGVRVPVLGPLRDAAALPHQNLPLYDVVPRWMQHTFDAISVLMLVVFACFLIFGSFYQSSSSSSTSGKCSALHSIRRSRRPCSR